MFDKLFEDISQNLMALLPDNSCPDLELKTKFQTILRQGFERLDLVTREEFDVQKKVLAKTRAKVDALEATLREKDTTE